MHPDEEHTEGEKNEEANPATAETKVGKGATAGLGRLISSGHSHGFSLLTVAPLSINTLSQQRIRNPYIYNALAKKAALLETQG